MFAISRLNTPLLAETPDYPDCAVLASFPSFSMRKIKIPRFNTYRNYSAARHPVFDIAKLKESTRRHVNVLLVKLKRWHAFQWADFFESAATIYTIAFVRMSVTSSVQQGRADTPTRDPVWVQTFLQWFCASRKYFGKEKNSEALIMSVSEGRQRRLDHCAGSNAAIKADQVWSTYGLRGTGIRDWHYRCGH